MSQAAKGSEQFVARDHPKYSTLTIIMENPTDGSNAGSIKFKAPFQTLGTHSRSQSSGNTTATHAFSRVLTDAKACIVSFRTFPCHCPCPWPVRLYKVLQTFTSKPFLSIVFKFRSASQGLSFVDP